MRRALLLALAVLALPLQAADLKPFSASYTADWKQLPMSGTAERSLVKNANGKKREQVKKAKDERNK